MLIEYSKFLNSKVYSFHTVSCIGTISRLIVDKENLKVIVAILSGRQVSRTENILDLRSVREYSKFGVIIDSADELVGKEDLVRAAEAIKAEFTPVGLLVETKKHSKLGQIVDYTFTDDDYTIKQIIVSRPLFKRFPDPFLTIPRKEIVEVLDDRIIVEDEEDTILKKAENEDFVPNFINPFRKTERGYVGAKADVEVTEVDDKEAKE
ncbi:MAG: hypothetical protein Q4A79_02450 [Candidatus Saccharibacteria bacterium]|nr:hypothetical protein [Candidatus Saccharibacteria bacterium]